MGCPESRAHSRAEDGFDTCFIAQPHFFFLRVDVYIDLIRGDVLDGADRQDACPNRYGFRKHR